MLNVNNSDLTKDLLTMWLNKLEYLDDTKKAQLYDIGCAFCDAKNIKFLYEINNTIQDKENMCRDDKNSLTYLFEEDKHILIYKDNKMEFTYEQIEEIIFGLIDLLEEIYPLGTAVELKKEYLEKMTGKKDIESVQVIIVNRFIFYNDVKTFFHYSGIVHPVGFLEEGRVIHFTAPLIDKVLKEGYSNEKDDVYNYLMKKELILDKGMHSFGFSTEGERKSFNKRIGVEGV